ncbi:MAG: hypothetical protein V1738_01020 [Patescibacteria group bacterium]
MGIVINWDEKSSEPKVGDQVLVVIDEFHRAGIHEGILLSIDNQRGRDTKDRGYWAYCQVKLTGDETRGWSLGDAYCGDGQAFPSTFDTRFFAQRERQAKKEILRLRELLKIERDVFHGLMKTLVNNDTANVFLEKLTQLLGK